ncbi:MAG: methyltransferase domain-containing protein [Candidatus Cloacimonetes bacterium]|nr:methyltransferase domain-containing protein [Candidatus Cloacimonadota bacterium]
MAIPIIKNWQDYYPIAHEGLGSSYERIILNKLLLELHERYQFKHILESPCFGFTGLTGINLAALALAGVKVQLEDDNPIRIEKIKGTWQELGLEAEIRYNPGFEKLDYPDKSFDFSFNFSALWFVKELKGFINELVRVTQGPILLCVPNQSGLGFKGQLKGYSPEAYPMLKPAFIQPDSIIYFMRKAGRQLLKWDYIDCPPWPDIGMSKEEYFQKRLGQSETSEAIASIPVNPVSILPFYKGEDADFEARMLRLAFLEKYALKGFKQLWAHHKYYLFV